GRGRGWTRGVLRGSGSRPVRRSAGRRAWIGLSPCVFLDAWPAMRPAWKVASARLCGRRVVAAKAGLVEPERPRDLVPATPAPGTGEAVPDPAHVALAGREDRRREP